MHNKWNVVCLYICLFVCQSLTNFVEYKDRSKLGFKIRVLFMANSEGTFEKLTRLKTAKASRKKSVI